MNEGKNVVKMLEENGRTELVELARLILPSPPIRVWEEEYNGGECEEECDEECEDCDWECEEEC